MQHQYRDAEQKATAALEDTARLESDVDRLKKWQEEWVNRVREVDAKQNKSIEILERDYVHFRDRFDSVCRSE